MYVCAWLELFRALSRFFFLDHPGSGPDPMGKYRCPQGRLSGRAFFNGQRTQCFQGARHSQASQMLHRCESEGDEYWSVAAQVESTQ